MVSSIFDLTETVTRIVEAERVSLDSRIRENEKRETTYDNLDAVKSKLNSFLTTLDTLQKEATFDTKEATSTDTAVLTATSSVGAAEILFDVDVNTLAVAARGESSGALFGVDREGSVTNVTGAEVNTVGGQDLDPNANVVSGSPNFEGGGNLTAGSFIINDSTILVTDSDTVNTILTKINNSSADVNAYYDDTNDKIVIDHNEIGEVNTITLESDTTGFFEKLKITTDYGATETQGVDPDVYRNLNDTAIGAGISYGYITVNDRTFLVDPDNDSLNDIILRINNSSAGVSMFYDETSDKVTMTSKTEGEDIDLKNDDSGFFAAVKLMNGIETSHTYAGTAASVDINGTTFTPDGNEITIHGTTIKFKSLGSASVKVEPDHDTFVDAVANMVTKFNSAATKINEVIENGDSVSRFTYRMMSGMKNLARGSITNDGTFSYLSEVGIKFSRGIAEGKMEFDEAKFRTQLNSDFDSVKKLFSFDSDNDGLYDDGGVTNTLENFLEDYTQGTLGLIDRRKDILTRMIDNSDRQIQRQEDYFESREVFLLESLVHTQRLLQDLENQYQRASSVRVDFNLISGNAL